MQGSLGGGSILSSVTLSSGQYHSGWNHVKLSKPVTIKEGMTLYVGYNIQGNQGPYDFLLFDQSTYAVDKKTGMATTARGSITPWVSTATSACVPSSRATLSPRMIFL